MSKMIRKLAIATAFGAIALSSIAPAVASAKEWPSDTIRFVVPYAAGGTTDLLSRKVADLLQRELGTVVVENRPGAGSTIATAQLARGGRGSDHTILMASPGHTIGPAIYPKLRYNPVKDFNFVHNVIIIPNVMVVPASSPYNTIAEFIEAAKTKELTFSSPGIGSSIHMSGELFKASTHTKMIHVPFRGSGEALPALLGGDVDVAFENLPTVLPHIKSGKLKVLAVTSAERSPFLEGVPTLDEAGSQYGLEGFDTYAWFGIITHKSMPKEAMDKINSAVNKMMASDDFVSFLALFGAQPGKDSGADFEAFIIKEIKMWESVENKSKANY